MFEGEVKADTPPIEVALGILPLSHGFGLVSTHSEIFRGNTTVLHGTFNMQLMLKSVQDHRIERMYLVSTCNALEHGNPSSCCKKGSQPNTPTNCLIKVPPVVAALANNPILFQLFDLSSIREIIMGAAACSDSLSKKMFALQPTWKILAGYGRTALTSHFRKRCEY